MQHLKPFGKQGWQNKENRRNTKTIQEIVMVLRGKGVWNNRENEKYGKIVKRKQGEYNKYEK